MPCPLQTAQLQSSFYNLSHALSGLTVRLSRSTLHLQLNKPPFCSSDSISATVWRVPDSLQTALVGACFPAVRLWPHNSSVRCGQRSVRSQGYRKSSHPAHRQCPIPQCSDVHGTYLSRPNQAYPFRHPAPLYTRENQPTALLIARPG